MINKRKDSEAQAAMILSSHKKFLGKDLFKICNEASLAEQIFKAPMAILSHGVEADPLFNFASSQALELFELSWSDLLQMPSRLSAEAPNREERKALLDRVNQYGFIDDYQGVRISSTGKRFLIKRASVWNLLDKEGKYCGQAAAFSEWQDLD
ncbi:MEKHLA domain-containing protein [Lentisphaera profundi]|uniref:MEKHLA domain-containing protein n=1 Tax=Lentisphaera profundi TaxID=1658616 RepID=A0ABY7VXM6_9BACT|nr:MEKHLA domain-containing protein [Lentisphaera profundi]WDE98033.1 MEKHLA domain-containing protein [Lentisphaera profundi]